MKVTNVTEASKQDLAYIQEDLKNLFNEVSENLEQTKINAQKNLDISTNAINADFDSLKKHENDTHYKKWNKRALIAGASSLAGIVGLIAAGAITQNPTFFSPGNMIVGGLLPALAVGFTNYLAAFSPKHQEKLDKIEQSRQTSLEELQSSQHILHDQKEIEVNEAWKDAIGHELFDGLDLKNVESWAHEQLENQKAKSL